MIMLAILATVSTPQFATCDIIERNHVYNWDGSKRFVQTIFWSLHQDGRQHIREYVYTGRLKMVPHVDRDHRRGRWMARWVKDGQAFVVHARTFRETHTAYDVEVLDRKWVPIAQRRRLGIGIRGCCHVAD